MHSDAQCRQMLFISPALHSQLLPPLNKLVALSQHAAIERAEGEEGLRALGAAAALALAHGSEHEGHPATRDKGIATSDSPGHSGLGEAHRPPISGSADLVPVASPVAVAVPVPVPV